jgi:hypothetical protein
LLFFSINSYDNSQRGGVAVIPSRIDEDILIPGLPSINFNKSSGANKNDDFDLSFERFGEELEKPRQNTSANANKSLNLSAYDKLDNTPAQSSSFNQELSPSRY